MAQQASQVAPLAGSELRGDERTHLFIAAALCSGGVTRPVHIRNMSRSGALVEGSMLPDPESAATLRRGHLEAPVRIVWKAGSRAGVAFSAIAHVADWMARTEAVHQRRVDEMIRSIRAGDVASPASAAEPPQPIRGELLDLRADLSRLEEGLLGDVIVAATHPEIQLLDIALQRVDRLLRAV